MQMSDYANFSVKELHGTRTSCQEAKPTLKTVMIYLGKV